MEEKQTLKGQINNLAKDTGLFAISNFGSKILLFLLTPLYTSILSTEQYGIADIIMTTMNFVYPILTLAIAESTLRFAFDKDRESIKVLSTSLLFVNISVIPLLLASPIIMAGEYAITDYWWMFIVIYTCYNYHNCLSNYAKAIGETALFAVQGIVMTVAVIVSNILFLVVFNLGINGYLLSIVIGYVVPIIIMAVKLKVISPRMFGKLDGGLLKDMLKYSLPMVPTILSWAINSSIDKYMIIGFVGLGASGIYGVAHKIPSIFTTVLSVFTQAWQLSAIENHGKEGEGEYYTLIYKYLDYISVAGCIVITMLAKPLASILFANEYFIGWKLVPALTVSAMFSSHAGFLAAAFRAAKKTKGLFYSVAAGACVNIVLNLLFIPAFGTMGAATATLLGFVATWLVRLVMMRKIVKLEINIAKTAVTYALFIASVVLVTAEVRFATAISAVLLLAVVLLHRSETKEICLLAAKAGKKIIGKVCKKD